MDVTSVNGNIPGKFQDDTITGTLSKSVTDGRTDGRADGRTDRQTDRRKDGQTERSVLGVAWSLLKTLLADNRYISELNFSNPHPGFVNCWVLFCFRTGQYHPYPSGLLHWKWDNHTIVPVHVKHPWNICYSINTTKQRTTKLSTTKPRACLLRNTVLPIHVAYYIRHINTQVPLEWRHNEHDGVSDHLPHDCLLNRLFRRRSNEKNIKAPRHWPLCGEFTGDRWIPRTKGQ